MSKSFTHFSFIIKYQSDKVLYIHSLGNLCPSFQLKAERKERLIYSLLFSFYQYNFYSLTNRHKIHKDYEISYSSTPMVRLSHQHILLVCVIIFAFHSLTKSGIWTTERTYENSHQSFVTLQT